MMSPIESTSNTLDPSLPTELVSNTKTSTLTSSIEVKKSEMFTSPRGRLGPGPLQI